MVMKEDRIREGILHADPEVRDVCIGYFLYGEPDEALMPLVIESIQGHGRDSAFSPLRKAEHLPQTPETLDWLMDELRRKQDLKDIQQDNYRFAVALALVNATPALLIPRHKEILALPAFPQQLFKRLDDWLRMSLMEWSDLWEEFEQFGCKLMAQRTTTIDDHHYSDLLARAMGRRRDHGDKVIQAMDGKVARTKRDLMEYLMPELVAIAGHMRLRNAIPRIIGRMLLDETDVLDCCGDALGRIGSGVVLSEVVSLWPRADTDIRLTLCEAMSWIRTDRTIGVCMDFLAKEDDMDTAVFLVNTLLDHFTPEGIDETQVLTEDDDPDDPMPDIRDLRSRAARIGIVMGDDFPGREEWYQEALACEREWAKSRPVRISDNF